MYISFSDGRQQQVPGVMSAIDRMLPLVDPIDLLLQLLPPVWNLHLDIIYILGDALNAKQVGSVGRSRVLLPPSVVDDLFMVSQDFLDLGKGVCLREGLLVRYRYSFLDLCKEYSILLGSWLWLNE